MSATAPTTACAPSGPVLPTPWRRSRVRREVKLDSQDEVSTSLTLSHSACGSCEGSADSPTDPATFHHPIDLAFDSVNSAMYTSWILFSCGRRLHGTHRWIDDQGSYKIRHATVPDAIVTSPLGSGVSGLLDSVVGTSADFQWVSSITIDSSSVVLFVAERLAHIVRRVVIASLAATTVVGSGTAGMTSNSDPLAAQLFGRKV